MPEGVARVDGVGLYYEVRGEGYPLVLLHDGLLDRRIWDGQFLAFSEHYRTVRYDRRGRGRSETGPDDFSHVEDLHSLLRLLGIERAHLVGVSNGGRISVDFALKYPEMCRSLVLTGPALSGYHMSEKRRREVSSIFSAAREGNAEKWAEMWLSDPYWAPAHNYVIVRRKLRRLLVDSLHDFLRTPRENAGVSATSRLPEIKAPTLLILGE